MKRLIIFFSGLLISSMAFPQNLTSAEQNTFYDDCKSSCVRNQLQAPENQFLMDKPFFFDSYCACFCGKSALRISRPQLQELALSVLQGQEPSSMSASLRLLLTQTEKSCQAAFFE